MSQFSEFASDLPDQIGTGVAVVLIAVLILAFVGMGIHAIMAALSGRG